jgi:hypothetical protein
LGSIQLPNIKPRCHEIRLVSSLFLFVGAFFSVLILVAFAMIAMAFLMMLIEFLDAIFTLPLVTVTSAQNQGSNG